MRCPALLYTVRDIFALRRDKSDFDADSDFSVLIGEKDKAFVYTRGNAVCAVNPSNGKTSVVLDQIKDKKIVYTIGNADMVNDGLELGESSFVILM